MAAKEEKMYHPRFRGRHYDMGIKFGTILKNAGIEFPIILDIFQTDHGIKSGKILKQVFPEAAEEIRGITDVLALDNDLFTAWLMCMGCCMYNLEEDNNREVRGCTAFSFEQAGHIFYGRDNDLPPFLKKGCKSVLYNPDRGNSFLLNTSSFINGEEGINNYGLTVAMTFVMPKMEEIKPGLNSVFLVRYLLEKCGDVPQAVKELQNLPIASCCNILLADRSGNILAAECCPGEINLREPESNGRGRKFIVIVNHFTSDKMIKHDACSGRGEYGSPERYRTAYDALRNSDTRDGIDLSKDILSGKHGFICQYKKSENFDTLWSSVFNITTGDIFIAEGNPTKSKYTCDKRYLQHIKTADRFPERRI